MEQILYLHLLWGAVSQVRAKCEGYLESVLNKMIVLGVLKVMYKLEL